MPGIYLETGGDIFPIGTAYAHHEVEILGSLQGIYVGDLRWQDDAACKGMDVNLWYPERGTSRECQLAKAICHDCPVKIQCRDYALKVQDQHGIWGELALRDRRRWNQERKAG